MKELKNENKRHGELAHMYGIRAHARLPKHWVRRRIHRPLFLSIRTISPIERYESSFPDVDTQDIITVIALPIGRSPQEGPPEQIEEERDMSMWPPTVFLKTVEHDSKVAIGTWATKAPQTTWSKVLETTNQLNQGQGRLEALRRSERFTAALNQRRRANHPWTLSMACSRRGSLRAVASQQPPEAIRRAED
jgi:hypothetical protein